MKIILSITTFILLSLAALGNDYRLHSNQLVNKYFDVQEIKDLELILEFFDQIVLNKTGMNDMQIAYPQFINMTINDTTYYRQPDDFFSQFEIDSARQKELFKEISDETKYKIWCLCTKFEKGGEAFLEIDRNGNYAKMIKKNRREHPYFKSYFNSLRLAFGTTPSMIMNLGFYVDEINYKKEINRLIFSIHILTLNALELRIK